jgi:malate synthase
MCLDPLLAEFVEGEALPVRGIEKGGFWAGLQRVIEEFASRNEAIPAVRDRIQSDLDEWHACHPRPLRDVVDHGQPSAPHVDGQEEVR